MISFYFIIPFISVCLSYKYGENGLCTTPYVATVVNKTYLFGNYYKLTWYNAYASCARLGMELLTIDSEYELNFLFDRMKYKDLLGETFWTSGYKLNDQWIWISTGMNFIGPEGTDTGCTSLSVSKSKLTPRPKQCGTLSYYICQQQLCD